jgi:hypothetical protein
MVLWQIIWLFTDLHLDNHFRVLKNHLPSQQEWIDARYDIPNHIGYQSRYEDYLDSFQNCLTNTFGSFR